MLVRQQPLELVVLGFKLAQALCLVHFKPGVFAAPVVKGPSGNAQLAANVLDLGAGLVLLDGPDNLFFGVSRLLYVEVSVVAG